MKDFEVTSRIGLLNYQLRIDVKTKPHTKTHESVTNIQLDTSYDNANLSFVNKTDRWLWTRSHVTEDYSNKSNRDEATENIVCEWRVNMLFGGGLHPATLVYSMLLTLNTSSARPTRDWHVLWLRETCTPLPLGLGDTSGTKEDVGPSSFCGIL